MYQFVLFAAEHVLNWKPPKTIEGPNSLLQVPKILKEKGLKKPLIVTDKFLTKLGMCNKLIEKLKEEKLDYAYFDDVQPNPIIKNIEDAKDVYLKEKCDSFIAVGGGSSMDCAKLAACRIARPRTPIKRMLGVLGVLTRLPPIIAVPTTAGTGSETTIAAVVADPEKKTKGSVIDPNLRPPYAVLDPCLTLTLPKNVTAATGMDAFTHAIEAYIGRGNMGNTMKYAEEAVYLISKNLEKCYNDGNDIDARMNMLRASFKAGLAFTQAYVGYVHAIAHTLGGIYNVAHGLANAVILPYVLEYYGESAHQRLAKLADIAGVKAKGNSNEEKANAFIDYIRDLNKRMGIPKKFDFIKKEDVSLIAKRSLEEGNPLYPVPKIMNREECESIVKNLIA
ncbi:iron-containing alcohol dehydrogenase [Histomonas meleagridis]|uniref:iron-containing alcohol dehydrogenase n=1 Tax=Histomonas meleagridis TaxID=135588 RepID=UPI00355AA326|nr:iron-containing alcohol dehydrogenase [Histomonas meleagridis]KAH0804327.1 iron-containing alcohol dehydrogenase [Histomonas meleagridis]